jgi:hypothetical protein
MTRPTAQTTRKTMLQQILHDRHFLVVAAILLLCAAGWPILADQIGLFLEKHPVPHPPYTQLREDFRLQSFRKLLGPFEMVAGSDQAIDKATLEELKMGTPLDKMRRQSGTSNWYLVRQYQRVGADPRRDPYARWYVQIFFYNGGTDTVPHVPERCRTEAGFQGMVSDRTHLKLGRKAPPAWTDGQGVPVQRVLYEQKLPDHWQVLQRVEYYTFAFNGVPTADWKQVRWNMRSPFISHAYFVKIQFGPSGAGSIEDPAEADRQAEAFMRYVLPEILKNLPTAQDVQKAAQES